MDHLEVVVAADTLPLGRAYEVHVSFDGNDIVCSIPSSESSDPSDTATCASLIVSVRTEAAAGMRFSFDGDAPVCVSFEFRSSDGSSRHFRTMPKYETTRLECGGMSAVCYGATVTPIETDETC